jgi:hypothetical protein
MNHAPQAAVAVVSRAVARLDGRQQPLVAAGAEAHAIPPNEFGVGAAFNFLVSLVAPWLGIGHRLGPASLLI